jgi:L-malate glycosyltransferase
VECKPSAKLLLVGKDVIDVFENRSTFELFKEILSPIAHAQVQYVPEVEYNEIKNYITSASVVVLPSFAEALPMVWLEAMAMEKALVTSNIGWANEIMINGITGYMESPQNHSSYADRILELVNNKKLANAMGKAARDQVLKQFSGDVVTKRNLEFYNEVITNS